MMILTAKVDFKKIMLILIATAAVLLALILVFGNRDGSSAATSTTLSDNDSRVKFLQEFGWEVTPAPKESTQVKIPDETGELFRRYNILQKSQGYDLSKFSGKKVMRYVYELRNYPGASEPVYATLLVYKNQVIGGDVTDTSAHGKVRGFQMPPLPQTTQPTRQEPTESSEA